MGITIEVTEMNIEVVGKPTLEIGQCAWHGLSQEAQTRYQKSFTIHQVVKDCGCRRCTEKRERREYEKLRKTRSWRR